MIYRNFLTFTIALLPLVVGSNALAEDGDKPPVHAEEPSLVLETRSRVERADSSGEFQEVRQTVRWNPKKTALIVCDMWDDHTCQTAAARVAEMAATGPTYTR